MNFTRKLCYASKHRFSANEYVAWLHRDLALRVDVNNIIKPSSLLLQNRRRQTNAQHTAIDLREFSAKWNSIKSFPVISWANYGASTCVVE